MNNVNKERKQEPKHNARKRKLLKGLSFTDVEKFKMFYRSLWISRFWRSPHFGLTERDFCIS